MIIHEYLAKKIYRCVWLLILYSGYGCSGYAASGIGLSILFQFYRAQPLWIPIGWNGIFLLINATMIGLLLKERNDADKLEEDPEQVWGVCRVGHRIGISDKSEIVSVTVANRTIGVLRHLIKLPFLFSRGGDVVLPYPCC